ncbi:MAG: VWA domain-containing protein, partial [Anaerolineales bacterium]|nr:VWA domain-containing protein [Anaerolineales bacterium]
PEQASLLNLSDELSPVEADMFAQALRQFSDRTRQMIERLIRGEELTPVELNRLAKFVGLTQADELRYQEWIVQRMKKVMHFPQVREALQELVEILAQLGLDKERGEQLRQMILHNQQAFEDQLRRLVGQRIVDNMSHKPPEDGLNGLLNRPFESLTEKDMELLRKEVQRLAVALRTRVALRQKRAKTGQLDAKATIRANLKHGNIPFQIKHREKSLKPRLVVICDISASMRSCSELMLGLLYALQDQISNTHAFAFIDHLEYISPEFDGKVAREAVQHVLRRMPSGHYNTDFGYSLENFTQDYLDTVDHRTTILIVGDGRNNYNDPHIDLFRSIARRCRRAIWFTPEAPELWGTGDSDMLTYASECDTIMKAGTLGELTTAVDKLLTQH